MNALKKTKLIPVILCGGSGSRLWPLSRKSYPKQFLVLEGNSELTLLQSTLKRLESFKNISEPIIICNEEHRFLVAEQCRLIDIVPEEIILEPVGKNTASAITLASLRALDINKDANLIVLSSDHILQNESQFLEAVECGLDFSFNNKIVTFGVIPDRPETGYGYIQTENRIDINNLKGHKIKKFIEKPDYKNAQEYISEGNYVWNSGIFMFKAPTILKELEKYSNNNLNIIESSFKKSKRDLDFLRINKDLFEKCENISIDKAVMEKTELGIVVPIDNGWSDIGSWYSLWQCSEKDENSNYIKGQVYSEQSSNNYIRSEGRLIVTLGIMNMVIVETDDVVLISDMNKTQEVKNVVKRLEEEGFRESLAHNLVHRPWGSYQSMLKEQRWQVKLIKVKPNSSLSLQMHHHRSEHWVVVKGTAKVEIEGEDKLLSENESIYIPIGKSHRLTNPGKMSLELIEVQSGPYLEEDDIVRFDDNYGRF
ncbi:MAG: mannose-1-phosphate guanylyltransferase/mannose-6-phosphate isomerase [Prochlorococcus marinus CUG1434]|nr:mannose-1-phosphate guanylyltransferase/mannose-6-phosphate isomerase [Prochlorococcus marinus CUG1434]